MSIADNEIHRYWARVYTRHHTPVDALFQIQGTILQEMLNAMELALEDDGIPPEVIRRVIQKLVYGSPHLADAEERIDLSARLTDVAEKKVVAQYPAGWLSKEMSKDLGIPWTGK